MYLLKDVRSFTYKLSPVIQDESLVAMLRDHKESKSQQIREFQEFERTNARKHEGLIYQLVRNPALLSAPPDDQNLLRLYAKAVRRALNLLYGVKNRLTDARYHLRRRNNYIFRLKKALPAAKKQAILKYYEEDLQAFKVGVEFIKRYDLDKDSIPSLSDLEPVLASGNLRAVAERFKDHIPAYNRLINLVKKPIWELKQGLARIKEKVKHQRFPKQARAVHDAIKRKVDYNFFLNKWMANHFILSNFDLDSIHELRNGKSSGGGKVPRGGEYRVLYNKLRAGFSSDDKTVQILHDRLGTPLHLEDRSVRNALVLAANVLKSQEKRLKLVQEIHAYFMKHLDVLQAFVRDKKRPVKLFELLNGEKYFLLDNILRDYRNNLLTFAKVVHAKTVNGAMQKEVHSYFGRVFEHLFHHVKDLFLAHSLTDRTTPKVQERKKFFKFTMDHIQQSQALHELVEKELDGIDFNQFIHNTNHFPLTLDEKREFVQFLRWSLTGSFLLYRVRSQHKDDQVRITPKLLETFEEHAFFSEVPLVSREVVLMHGDDSYRSVDATWNVPKIGGNISEILDFNARVSEKLRFRWKLLQERDTWMFEDFEASCPDLHKWFSFNELLKRLLGDLLQGLRCRKVNGYFDLKELSIHNFEHLIDPVFKKYQSHTNDEFHAYMLDQLRALLQERYNQYTENPCPKTYRKFFHLLVDKLDAASQHVLLKQELKHLEVSDFGKSAQKKIEQINQKGLPLERINIMRLKKVFQAHPQECPEAIRSKLKLYKVKDYVIQRKHLLLKKKEKLLINIPVEILVPVTPNKSERITGVDWGIRKDVSASIFDFQNLEFVKDLQLDETEIWEKILASRDNIARLQRVKAFSDCDSLRKGKFFKPQSKSIIYHGLKNRERLKQIAHLVSTELVQWSVDIGAKTISVESLKSLRPEKGNLSRLLNFRVTHSPRALLKTLLSQKIRRYGGKLYAVNARHTSQYPSFSILDALKSNRKLDCWYGNTTKGFRTNNPSKIPPPKERGGEYFYHEAVSIINADINAAQNVALKLFHHFK